MSDLRRWIRDIPDFPKPGILFRDLTPLLADAGALRELVRAVAAPFQGMEIDAVVGTEARGFIIGTAVAVELGHGFVPVRKPGKLPYRTHRVTYSLEYGEDAIEMHTDGIASGARVLVVDDLIATGGTAAATIALVRNAGAEVVGCSFAIELEALGGRSVLDVPKVHSVIQY